VPFDAERADLRRCVPACEPHPELLLRHVEIAELDERANSLGPGAILVALRSGPEAVLENHVDPQREGASGDFALQRFDAVARRVERLWVTLL
jgi:hypothetical protein